MADQDLDRNDDATPHKLDKARKKGQVSKSQDVVSAAVFAVAVIYLNWQGLALIRSQFDLDRALLLQIGQSDAGGAALLPLMAALVRDGLAWCVPLFTTLMLAAIVANVAQTGPVMSFDPVKVDFDRINPVNGLKRIFSLRTLFDTARACIKLAVLVLVSFLALKNLAPQFYNLSSLSTAGYLRTLLEDVSSLGLKIAVALVLIAIVDLVFTRREFAKKMRMSKRELKDEVKQREGDPRIRARMRELQREMRKRTQGLQRTREADVLLTNPTHYAVALRYVHGQMESPQLVAKGAGPFAFVMRQIAARHRVPVVRSPALTRKLFGEMQVDHHVPPHMFADVARVIVWVFAMREQQRSAKQGQTTT